MTLMPEILKRCELPLGTRVKVYPFVSTGEPPFQGMVRGYDIGRTKFEIGREYSPGYYAEGGMWCFPGEIAGYYLSDEDGWWNAAPLPEEPEPMAVEEYQFLVGQPVEARYIEIPRHIYGEPRVEVRRGILLAPTREHHLVQAFYGHHTEGAAWESVRPLDYDELTTQDLRDWFIDDPKAAMEFGFHALWRKERAKAAREAAIEDMRH